MRKSTTKRALLMSGLAMLLSVSMLVGTTFAWFTDTVSSGTNTIVAGNLDIELYHSDSKVSDEKVDNNTKLFDDVDRWEPGAMVYEKFTIANEGDLALKYQFTLNALNATEVEDANGNKVSFASMLKVAVVDSTFGYTRAEVLAIDDWSELETFSLPGALDKSESDVFGIVIYWIPSDNDNLFNMNNGKTDTVSIELGVTLFATQNTVEEDGFDSNYDAGAPWTGLIDIDWYLDNPDAAEYVLTTAEELAGLAAIVNGTATAPVTTYAAGSATSIKDDFKGKTIKLGGNIDLNEIEWTPIGDNPNPFLGNFDGQGHTVSNLFVSNDGWAGLIGHAGKSAGSTIKNVTVDGATILSNRMAGAVVGQIYGSIDNCHVKNAEIIVVPNVVGDSYDNGDKVGGIVGWLGDNGNNRTLSNCTAEKVELSAYRDVGGIVGYVASSTTVSGNAVSGVEITVNQTVNNYGDKDVNAGYICGRVNGTITEENNTNAGESAIESTYNKNGLTFKADGDENVTLYLVPESYAETTLTVPEGVTAIGNYAFAYNSNVETVVLASTVRDLGRGFDSSTVKKVVLNEGLTTISSRAFRSTTALEEVVFSSTVTEIADNAFQKSAIKEIVIPASVKTIGETAFGASLIETVTFEGDIEIQGYAFRGCTKLRTVNMFGEDVKFVASTLNGRNSCWFCNGESNNPNTSNITFTVRSEEIKERVLTAMGAERNNTPVIVDDGFEKVESVEELIGALANATAGAKIDATGVVLTINEDHCYIPEGVTIKGLTVDPQYRGGNYFVLNGDNIVFENCTFGNNDRTLALCGAAGTEAVKVVYNNCTFVGAVITNFVDNEAGTATFNNCTFTGTSMFSYVMAMGGTHEFVGCTFDYSSNYNMGVTTAGYLNIMADQYETYRTTGIIDGCRFLNKANYRIGGDSSKVTLIKK